MVEPVHNPSPRKKIRTDSGSPKLESRDDLKAARKQLWFSLMLLLLTILAIIIIYFQFFRPQKEQIQVKLTDTPAPVTETKPLQMGAAEQSESFEPRESKIVVRSDLEGAEVWINGTYSGLTPMEINNPKPGRYMGIVKVLNPTQEKEFQIEVLESPPRIYTKYINFGKDATGSGPGATPAPKKKQLKSAVEFPDEVKFGSYYHIIVPPIPGIQIYKGTLKLQAKCKADRIPLSEAPGKPMFSFRQGLILENLKPVWCKGPGRDAENGAVFYIELSTSDGQMMLGSATQPYSIEFIR